MKSIIVSLIITAIGLVCFAAFHLIGSSVDANGLLQEPFALLPIGSLLISFGGISSFVSAVGFALEFYAQPVG